MFRALIRVFLLAAFVLPLTACGSREQPPVSAVVVPETPGPDHEELAKAAAKAKRDAAEASFQRGRDFVAKKNDAEALKAFTEAIGLNSQHADAYIERAAVHDRAGKLNDASYDYRQAIGIELDPKTTARAYWLRGDVMDRLGKREDYRFDRERAMQLDPDYQKLVTAGDVRVFNHTDKKLTLAFDKFVNPDGTLRTFPPGFRYTILDDHTFFLLAGTKHMPAKSVRYTISTELVSKTFEQEYEKGMTLEIHIYETDLHKK